MKKIDGHSVLWLLDDSELALTEFGTYLTENELHFVILGSFTADDELFGEDMYMQFLDPFLANAPSPLTPKALWIKEEAVLEKVKTVLNTNISASFPDTSSDQVRAFTCMPIDGKVNGIIEENEAGSSSYHE